MSSLYILIPITLLILAIAIAVFIWAVNHRQFEDLESPATRILFDDDEEATQQAIQSEHSQNDE
ncbi:MAG: cbb3-type cytochrome oxidase assembly protein CcoS [Gammaproteobacteria bacterium]|nr:MAG: cbb3-type cytochrome oxidase assembly protein CcoS [Gammaproteobacteria bacterium]